MTKIANLIKKEDLNLCKTMSRQTNRKWQNLIHKKCPNCGSDLKHSGDYLLCENISKIDKTRNCFFIKKQRAIELIADHNHPAFLFLTDEEKDTVNDIMQNY